MKRLIGHLILMVLPLISNAQNSLETSVLNELNSYRYKRGLCTLKIDESLSTWSTYHAKYLSKLNEINKFDRSHDEKIDLPNWRELTLAQRDSEFNKTDVNKHISKGEVQLRMVTRGIDESEIDLAKKIILSFHNSADHNNIINSDYDVDYDLPIVGISVIKNNIQLNGSDVYTVVIDLGVNQR